MAVTRLLYLAAVFASLCHLGTSQCSERGNCALCIQESGCQWCSETLFAETRCFEVNTTTTCPAEDIQNPQGSIGERTTPSPPPMDITPSPVQLTEIDVAVRLGPDETQSFNFNVTPQRNIPLDLYILMDLSGSMRDDLVNVRNISRNIVSSLSDITNNVQLGFGSFNDKPDVPFTQRHRTTYAFRHQITLTRNETSFIEFLDGIRETANADNPENGLEALAQVAACEKIIGWRDRAANALRIVLFITDDAFHYSGEGRYAGILTPFDGQCYLPNDTRPADYTMWNVFDYPSVGQVNALLREQNIVPIFAAASQVIDNYRVLAELINLNHRAVTAEVLGDSANILQIIRDEVQAILQQISLNPHRVMVDGLSLSYFVNVTCPENAMKLPLTPTLNFLDGFACGNVSLETTAMFDVQVTLLTCPVRGTTPDTWPIPIAMEIPSFGSFIMQLTPHCNCDCEREKMTDSSKCNNNGDLACGVCVCFEGFCGVDCNISLSDVGNAQDCPLFNGLECFDRGTCECGRCICDTPLPSVDNANITNPMFSGEACECTNYGCGAVTDDDIICAGQGECCNGMCSCNTHQPSGEPYYPEGSCECVPRSFACRDPTEDNSTTSRVFCRGRGTCRCEGCSCELGFDEPFCRPSAKCGNETVETCILCAPGNVLTGDNCNICNDPGERAVVVDEVEYTSAIQGQSDLEAAIIAFANTNYATPTSNPYSLLSLTQCSFTDNNMCDHSYYILTGADGSRLYLTFGPSCGPSTILGIPVYALALIILGALLLLGILLLILIKVIFMVLDYIEYKKWDEETRKADLSKNLNPLYQNPEREYKNVAYGKAF